ncbi:protein adenylyltransferase SelO [Hahella sp. NBU794]|uniref:protein adenylyltransferase SelO n=1 Tax=Hahella sp. NBU794 TaxID=3422590 RepID=UPI003D6F453F
MPSAAKSLNALSFDNSYARLPPHFYQKVAQTPLEDAHLISFNGDVAETLGLDRRHINPEELARYCGGGGALEAGESIAMKYAGHQFGHYNPELGDGRGLLLGEVVTTDNQRLDLHLKGAGRTAYSRFGDGRAVLRSSIREYLVSAAMSGLGISSTRALCLVGSEEYTMRNGMEPCAMVLRVTPCHIRFGHFEHFYYLGQHDDLKLLADYCIERYFPGLQEAENPYLAMFNEVRDRTADLVAQWQSYGFVHGVMNTDNMSIIGETFDYGPFTFLDSYDPNFISNKNDTDGRYAFKQQPGIALWNLSALAQALLPLIPLEELKSALDGFAERYSAAFYGKMAQRLGFSATTQGVQDSEQRRLIDELLSLFTTHNTDMNRFMRALGDYDGSESSLAFMSDLSCDSRAFSSWKSDYRKQVDTSAATVPDRTQAMQQVNPEYILRNYMLEEAIREAHQGDYLLVQNLLRIVKNPFNAQPGAERYADAPPDWAGGICLTCSS